MHHVRGAQWNICRIPQSEALLLRLKNTPREMEDSPNIIDCLRSAVSSAMCYTGVRGEAGETADRVIELLSDLR